MASSRLRQVIPSYPACLPRRYHVRDCRQGRPASRPVCFHMWQRHRRLGVAVPVEAAGRAVAVVVAVAMAVAVPGDLSVRTLLLLLQRAAHQLHYLRDEGKAATTKVAVPTLRPTVLAVAVVMAVAMAVVMVVLLDVVIAPRTRMTMALCTAVVRRIVAALATVVTPPHATLPSSRWTMAWPGQWRTRCGSCCDNTAARPARSSCRRVLRRCTLRRRRPALLLLRLGRTSR